MDYAPKNNEEIASLVRQHPREELLPFNNFEHPANESYGRRQLYANDSFCIYLMSWCPGDFTAIHDHGTTQWGCVLAFTLLEFEPVHDELPVILKDKGGTRWDVFGRGVSGPHAGQQRTPVTQMMGYWFSFAAFYPDVSFY